MTTTNPPLYLEGAPKDYRFNAVEGGFFLGENKIPIGTEFSFTPIAARVFEGKAFGRNSEGLWVELYFVDDQEHVSIIIFNGPSAVNFIEATRQYHLGVKSIGLFSIKAHVSQNGKYFVADFKFNRLTTSRAEENEAIARQLDLYYQDLDASAQISQVVAQSTYYHNSNFKSMYGEKTQQREMQLTTHEVNQAILTHLRNYTDSRALTALLAQHIKVSDVESIKTGVVNQVEEQFMQKIEEEIRGMRPVHIQVKGRPVVKLKGRAHYAFEEALQLLSLETQIYLGGPAGSGKTTLADQCAKALSLPFGHISCTLGMSEAQLLGRMTADGTYTPSQFIEIYENGGVFLFDEVDAADPNTLLVINSALANGHISVPSRPGKPRAIRHKHCYIVVAANTWGNGSVEYIGRNQLDAAFLDRFVASRIEVTYDKELEKSISIDYPYLALLMWKIRANVAAHKMRKLVSTRSIVSGMRLIRSGWTLSDFLFKRFFVGWTKEEIEKALKGPQEKQALDPSTAPAYEPPKDQQEEEDEDEDGEGQEGEGEGEGKSGDSTSETESESESQNGKSKNDSKQNGKDSTGNGKDGKPQSGKPSDGKGSQGKSQQGQAGKSQSQGADSTQGGQDGGDNQTFPDDFDFGQKPKETPKTEGQGTSGNSTALQEKVMETVLQRIRKK